MKAAPWFFVALGSGLGSCLRMALWLALPVAIFPWPTFLANLSGSFLIGWLAGRFSSRWSAGRISPQMRAGLSAGFCGGFTTCSFLSLQVWQWLHDGLWLRAVGYMMLTLIFSLAATAYGFAAGRR